MKSIKINKKQAKMLKEMGTPVVKGNVMKITEDQYNKIKDMSVKYFPYKDVEIMWEPHYDEYFVGDEQFQDLASAKVYIDKGGDGDVPIPYHRDKDFNEGQEVGGVDYVEIISKLYDEIYGQMVGYWAQDYTTIQNIAKKKNLDFKKLKDAFFAELHRRNSHKFKDSNGFEDEGLWGFNPHLAKEGQEVGGLPVPREQSFRDMPTEDASITPTKQISKNFSDGLNNEVKRDIGNLYEEFINELYGLNEGDSTKFSKLIKLMEVAGMIENGRIRKDKFNGKKETVREVISQGLYEMHHGGTQYKVMEAIERTLKENGGYPAGAANDPSAPYNQNQKMSTPSRSKNQILNLVWFDNEDALFTGEGGRFIFNTENVGREAFEPYVEREQTDSYKDEQGDHYTEYSDDWEVDGNAVEQFVNDNYSDLTKGVGVDAFESGIELVKIDDELGQYLVGYFKADEKLQGFLLSMDETTTGTSSGAFEGSFNTETKFPSNLPEELEETTTATSSGAYDSPKAIDTTDKNFWFAGNKQNERMNETNFRSGFEMTEREQLEYNYYSEVKQMSKATSQPEQQMLAKRVIEAASKLGVKLPKSLFGLEEGKQKKVFKLIEDKLKNKNIINEQQQERFVAEIDFYVWANDDDDAKKQANKIVQTLDAKFDNRAKLNGLYSQPFGTLGNRVIPLDENAHKDTQFPGGGFVDIDDCTKLNNNTKAQDGGCSQGAVDSVVSVKKSKNSVVAKKKGSLKEGLMREALKLQHDKQNEKLIVISDLEGRAASKETFTNKKVLKQAGFNWTGQFWAIDADKLDVAKKTLTLINKAEYIINTLEDVEEAVAGSNADNKSLLTAKLDQYIMDLANATDEVALGAEIRRYLTFFSKFHNYSFHNRILIYIQRPEATRVASYNKWKEKHRQVKKGAKSITVLAPIIRKDARDNVKVDGGDIPGIENVLGKQYDKQVSGFRNVRVFDISDTEPIDERGEIPDMPAWQADNTPSEIADILYGAISEVAVDMGVKVTADASKRGEAGYSAGDHINISSDVEGVGRLSVMVHELAHELMHRRTSSIYFIDNTKENDQRALKELQAESVSYVVLKHYDIPVKQHATYLALWRANKEKIQNNLKIISKVSQFIITKMDEAIARKEKMTQSV